MGEVTGIEWTDHSKSPWHGCQHMELADGTEHPACAHCYAERQAKRNPGTLGEWGPNGTRIASMTFDRDCRAWNAKAAAAGVRASVFPSICDPFEAWRGKMHNSKGEVLIQSYLGDVRDTFDETLESWEDYRDKQAYKLLTMQDCRADMFRTIDACPNLDFLLLTKRPGNIPEMWPAIEDLDPAERGTKTGAHQANYLTNAHLGTSISDQQTAVEMLNELVKCRDLTPVLFVSAEPLLGPVDLTPWLAQIDWVIVGGESGHEARPCHPAWVRSIRDQCQAAGVPFFFKQWGEWRPKLAAIAGEPEPICAAGVEWGTLTQSGEWFPYTTPWNGNQDADSETGEIVMAKVGRSASGSAIDGVKYHNWPGASK